MMIRRSTWIVLGLFAALLVFTLWWQRAEPAEAPAGDTTPTLEALWSVGEGQVVMIRVEDLEADLTVEVERLEDGTWGLLQPETGPADTARVEQAAAWLELPIPRSRIADPEDPAAFGLDSPARRITAELSDGRQLVIDVGDEAPTGTMSYIRVEGQADVLVVSKYGLSEVLSLLDPLPIPAPTATETAAATQRASPTAAVQPSSATPAPAPTPAP